METETEAAVAVESSNDIARAAAAARAKILEFCAPALAAYGIDPGAATDDFDLHANGAVDSLGFVELVVVLEETFGVELELEELDPEELTVLGPLSEHVGARVVAAKGAVE